MPKFGTKITYMGIFDQKCLIWVFFGWRFKKLCHIWNEHPQICLIAKFCRKTKMTKFGTKSTLFRYFWASILKNYCHISNQHPQICLFSKFHKKAKMGFSIFGFEFQKPFYHTWNQHPQVCLFAKFHEKTRTPIFGTKNA